ncbi:MULTISPECIES: dienelactone hydrolase family protein [Streptomyces]|uniref:Dienelactone hydrolase family protein n=2 Tax=Streptomyces TaxID=1883 RepID=A0ABU4KBC1_9ACTN|nr:dienelactone hydrolase family protein [Streptomyces roseolus]MDX2295065.1 dienelactone hydrolase family protein [Streptomyces roseolus]
MTTFVLVGGAFTGGWLWDRVAARLRDAGAEACPVTLDGDPGAGLGTHARELTELVDRLDDPELVLVGHDYGIHPVLAAADRRPDRVVRVVYVAAGLPSDGDPALLLVRDETVRARLGHDTAPLPAPRGEEWARWGSLDGLTADDLALLDRRAAPQPAGTLTEPLRLGGAVDRVPAAAVMCTADGPGVDMVEMLVRTGPTHLRKLAGPGYAFFDLPAGHWPMLSHPAELAGLLVRAAAGEGRRLTPDDDQPAYEEVEFLLETREFPYERLGRLDVYPPDGEGRRPAVLLVHGGPVQADRSPTPRDTPFYRGYARHLAGLGVVGATVDHRLHALTDYARAADDLAEAVERLRAHPRTDPDRIALWIFSGGGLLATDWLAAPPPWLRCLALSYPVLATPPGWETVEARFRPVAALAGAGRLPVVLVRAGREHPAFAATVEEFLTAAGKHGADVEIVDVPEGRHGFEAFDRTDASRAAVTRAARAVVDRVTGAA